MKIKTILGREILDSRGQPTVEAEVTLDNGLMSYASVPSGASTGSREALELRDKDPKRYLAKGVLKAVTNITRDIASLLQGKEVGNQKEIDDMLIKLDGTDNKSHLGANATLAVSLAVAKVTALNNNQSLVQYLGQVKPYILPVPLMNIINGGAHADNNLDFQEFMIVPFGFKLFSDALRAGSEVFHTLKSLLKQQGFTTNVGDEGGFAPELPNQESAFQLIMEAIHKAGFSSKEIGLGLDIASSEFYQNDQYILKGDNKVFDYEGMTNYLKSLVKQYPIITIEDGMAENDWRGWRYLTSRLSEEVQLVGDDLFVTNTLLLRKGIEEHIANAILIKPNQIGTLTETIAAINLAKESNYNTIISHRSGETEDTFIADLAVARSAGQIKTGSLCRTDRVAKYNQLLRLEAELGSDAYYASSSVFNSFKRFKSMESTA